MKYPQPNKASKALINSVAGGARLTKAGESQDNRGAKEAHGPDALFGVGV